MCGIGGFFGEGGWRLAGGEAVLRGMANTLRHRGPDAIGVWFDEGALVGLGHRRLSILDLSPAGAQPMHSRDERYVLTYNGEIYNFPALRGAVEARRGVVSWRGHSDTEVLIEFIAEFGVVEAMSRLDGMFALALFDWRERSLTLARDPFGEKPLFYGRAGAALIFGSELKSLLAYPGFEPVVSLPALAAYFKYSYVPCPATIYEGVWKLPPAHLLVIDSDEVARGSTPNPQPYWEPISAALRARSAPFQGSEADALEAVRTVLIDATARRMVSDVPLGSLLSGGVDSSIVTALMQATVTRPVRTFSIGVSEEGYNEAPHAREVASVLGTDHTELVLTPGEVQGVIPDIPAIYDEPFSDSSQVPTHLVSRMARRDVTVVLSGDGGDELFGGYNRYFHAPRLWRTLGRVPAPARRAAAALAQAVPMSAFGRAVAFAGPLAPRELASGRAAEKLQKLAWVLSAADEPAFHDRLLETGHDVHSALAFDAEPAALPRRLDGGELCELSFAERAMLLDVASYMPDDLLTKVDRASMAVSLEVRTPFLNRELFELAWRLPLTMKIGAGEGKRVLRELLCTYIPRELVDRPKSGFAVPVGRWLRTGLRDWAEANLSEARLADAGVFNVKEVRRRFAEHLAGQRDHETFLWSVLMFQGWRRASLDRDRPHRANDT